MCQGLGVRGRGGGDWEAAEGVRRGNRAISLFSGASVLGSSLSRPSFKAHFRLGKGLGHWVPPTEPAGKPKNTGGRPIPLHASLCFTLRALRGSVAFVPGLWPSARWTPASSPDRLNAASCTRHPCEEDPKLCLSSPPQHGAPSGREFPERRTQTSQSQRTRLLSGPKIRPHQGIPWWSSCQDSTFSLIAKGPGVQSLGGN